jgi:GNAT superfamily N-acetyltransferase
MQFAHSTMDLRHDRSTFPDAAAVADCPITIAEVGMEQIDLIRRLNVAIFDDEHIINTFDRDDILLLVAWSDDETPVGFKLGYQLDAETFYSAKGGVREAYRRNGIARALLYAMLAVAEERGYERFVYDTFPNKHPGMTVMGLDEGFTVVRAGYSPRYQDYRLRFAHSLNEVRNGPE